MSRLFGNMKWTLALTVRAMMIVTGFTDPDGIRDMKPAQVLDLLFG